MKNKGLNITFCEVASVPDMMRVYKESQSMTSYTIHVI